MPRDFGEWFKDQKAAQPRFQTGMPANGPVGVRVRYVYARIELNGYLEPVTTITEAYNWNSVPSFDHMPRCNAKLTFHGDQLVAMEVI